MYPRRLAALTLTLTAIATAAAPAVAATPAKWSTSKCSSYAKKYTKSTKTQKTAANKTLKSHKCKVTVK